MRPEGRITFSQKFACPVSGFTIAEIEPRLFSFNAPQGACPACDGLGEKLHFDPGARRAQREPVSIKQGRSRALGEVEPAEPLLHAGARQSLATPFRLQTSKRRGIELAPEDHRAAILYRHQGAVPVVLKFIDGRKSPMK